MEHFFSQIQVKTKKKVFTKMEHFFSPNSSGHLRSDVHQSQIIGGECRCRPYSNYRGGYSQIIGGYIHPISVAESKQNQFDSYFDSQPFFQFHSNSDSDSRDLFPFDSDSRLRQNPFSDSDSDSPQQLSTPSTPTPDSDSATLLPIPLSFRQP